MIIKVWITKYALTQGIVEKEAYIYSCGKMIEIRENNQRGEFYHDEEWHKTKQEAIKKAEEMKEKKVFSLEKQLVKLKTLKFE